eukprot:5948901-Alexandrium_andersonii.AAC.1
MRLVRNPEQKRKQRPRAKNSRAVQRLCARMRARAVAQASACHAGGGVGGKQRTVQSTDRATKNVQA